MTSAMASSGRPLGLDQRSTEPNWASAITLQRWLPHTNEVNSGMMFEWRSLRIVLVSCTTESNESAVSRLTSFSTTEWLDGVWMAR